MKTLNTRTHKILMRVAILIKTHEGIGNDCLQKWRLRLKGLLFFLRKKFTKLFNKIYQIYPKFFLANVLSLESAPVTRSGFFIKTHSFLHHVFFVATRNSSTVNWYLPQKNGWVYRVRSIASSQNEKNVTLPVIGYKRNPSVSQRIIVASCVQIKVTSLARYVLNGGVNPLIPLMLPSGALGSPQLTNKIIWRKTEY